MPPSVKTEPHCFIRFSSSKVIWNAVVFLSGVVFLNTVALPAVASAAEPIAAAWRVSETGTQASLRGISAVDDEIVWVSGSEATVLRTLDGGETWESCGPEGYGELEFRCVHAMSSDVACIASAGTPAVLLRTEDGGATWEETYRAESEAAFFDAMRFWDASRGIAMSDPVDGRLLIVETQDGGKTWEPVSAKLPLARAGEAAFAASNTLMLLGDQGQVWLGTGGAESDFSRMYTRAGWNDAWIPVAVPMPSSQAAGIFSICQLNPTGDSDSPHALVCVGGDYRITETSKVTACISLDNGTTWQTVADQPVAFRSAVLPIPTECSLPARLIAVGPTGTDVSNNGTHWHSISDVGFHSLSAGQTHIFACGSEGRFARLE